MPALLLLEAAVTSQKHWAVLVCLGQLLGKYQVHILAGSFQLSADTGVLVGVPTIWSRGRASHRLSYIPSFPNLPLSTLAPRGCVLSSALSVCPYHTTTALMHGFTDSNPLSNEMLTCGLDSK